jgi:hypothetical protein
MVRPEIAGDIYLPDRFGAAAIWDDKLWIVGGAWGGTTACALVTC